MMSFNLLNVFLAFSLLMASVDSQDQTVRNEPFALYLDNPNSCDTIIEASVIEGDCCSFNTTSGNGCVLNIVNGNCQVSGQYWTLDWTSTMTERGARCPASEYPELALASPQPNEDNSLGDSSGDSSGNNSFCVVAFFSAMAAGLVATAL